MGWQEGIVGVATVGADLELPSGFALRTGKPVISNHLENEQRFRTPELLLEHGIRRAMNVILQGDGSPYGVLEVDSRSEGEFGEHDIAFLQGAANILGMAIERQRYERHLKAALDRHQVLLKEISHRVKNSLQIVSSMLHLQAISANDDSLIAQQLAKASSRVSAIGRAYERLAYDADFENIDLSAYLQAVCADAISAGSNCKLDFDGISGIWLSADRAIPLALIVNELVTNAVKYAFSNRHAGHIYVHLVRQDANTALVSVRDDGVGLAADFDLTKSKGLGMQIVAALVKQLGADITRTTEGEGNEFVVSVHVNKFQKGELRRPDVRFGSWADIASRPRHVRYSPESGHSSARFACPPLLCLAQREKGAERGRNRARDIESQRASVANRRVAHRDIEWVWQQALPA